MNKKTGGLDDFINPEMVVIPKQYYDRLLLLAKLMGERMNAKDAIYGLEKDIEKAMHKLKPNAVTGDIA